MIHFTVAADGDMRGDPAARAEVSKRLGIASTWATVDQVHGAAVRYVDAPGAAGPADALFTDHRRLPIVVFTADCFAVVLMAPNGIGIAHAGWRGAASDVVGSLRTAMSDAGLRPVRAVIGPGIHSCCFEVGPEVAARFPGKLAETTWGSRSVDLVGVLEDQLTGLPVVVDGDCTYCGNDAFSFRRDGTDRRMGAIAWIP